MTIGDRLREERERLDYSQSALAELAETTKKSQIDYEKGITFPKASYLEVIAKAGADIQYIITGTRGMFVSPADPLTVREKHLLANYRGSNEEGKRAVEATASALSHKDGDSKTKRG